MNSFGKNYSIVDKVINGTYNSLKFQITVISVYHFLKFVLTEGGPEMALVVSSSRLRERKGRKWTFVMQYEETLC